MILNQKSKTDSDYGKYADEKLAEAQKIADEEGLWLTEEEVLDEIEALLDQAEQEAETTDKWLTHEEVFGKIREYLSKMLQDE